MRLERVPGGLRLASWRGGSLERAAPVLETDDLRPLIASAADQGLFAEAEAARLRDALDSSPAEASPARPNNPLVAAVSADSASASAENASHGRSPGRTGELRDELRVEPLGDGALRIARWVMRPGRGWELQEAPVMLPAARYAEALADAGRRGLLAVAGQPDS